MPGVPSGQTCVDALSIFENEIKLSTISSVLEGYLKSIERALGSPSNNSQKPTEFLTRTAVEIISTIHKRLPDGKGKRIPHLAQKKKERFMEQFLLIRNRCEEVGNCSGISANLL